MAGVNQTLEIIRLTVSMMRRVKVDAVVAPTSASGKFGNRMSSTCVMPSGTI
jgi:hypothetical protein